MKLFKWQKGRQKETEYWKFPLWYFRIGKYGFDAYILKYSPGTVLDWHKDPVDGEHYRLNIKLKGWSSFLMKDDYGYLFHRYFNPRFVFFRPDLYSHKLTVVKKTIKLSFGFVKFNT